MKLRDIADIVGVGEFDPVMEDIYAAMPQSDTPACDLAVIDRLQQDYNTFGEFYELVRAVAIEVNNDPNRSTWIKVALEYTKGRTRRQINRIPVPNADGTVVSAMLPLYILVGMLPGAIEEYRRRGFNEKEIGLCMRRIWDGIRIVKRHTGMPGIDETYYRWQTLFAMAKIFEFEEGLQFELKKAPAGAVYIKHKETGKVVPLLSDCTIHRTGLQVLGSAGYTDAEGAFEATVTEDEENIYGYGSYDNKVETTLHAYSKAEWEIHLRPGDDMLSLHIPEGADISLDVVIPQVLRAREIVRTRYPEHKGTEIFGSSWILNNALLDIVKPGTKVAEFMTLFTCYPICDDATSIFSFVFDRKPENLEDLPEDTSLRRGLKKMYLEGRYNHIFAGMITKV